MQEGDVVARSDAPVDEPNREAGRPPVEVIEAQRAITVADGRSVGVLRECPVEDGWQGLRIPGVHTRRLDGGEKNTRTIRLR